MCTFSCHCIIVLRSCFLYSGLVPLHNACSYGHYDVTQLLIEVLGNILCLAAVFFCSQFAILNIFLYEFKKMLRNTFLYFIEI